LNDSDYFELFGLARAFELDPVELESNWKQRIALVHPDRFAAENPAQKRVAMHWSAQLNEGYRVLRDPLRRAQYLCELAGHPCINQPGTSMEPAFLMQQIEWREALEQAQASGDRSGLEHIESEIAVKRRDQMAQTGQYIAQQQWIEAVKSLHEWMFVEKFLQELGSARRALVSTK
jgi:molecular chaperone HscB